MRYVACASGIGRLEDDRRVALIDVSPRVGVAGFFSSGRRLADLAAAPVRAETSLDELVLAGAVAPSSAIYGVGLNYRSKLRSTGRAVPERPTLFAKSASAVAAPGAPIVIPDSAPDAVDFEGEIGVVVGAPLYNASRDEAEDSIAAVLAANDVTARDVMRTTNNPMLAKSFPGFAQFGSFVADPRDYGGIAAIALTTRVNDELRQRDLGEGMLLDPAELIALLSSYVELHPGDIVLTGTPAGTGEETGSFLQPGDVVAVQIADLPPLVSHVSRTRVVAPVT